MQTYWIDYDGRLRPYSTIASGETFDQGTYETHPWTFMTVKASSRNGKAKSERRRCVVNDSPIYVVSGEEDVSDGSLNDREKKARVVEIRRPRVVDWSPDVHEAFSIGFKRAVRCFLLAHQRSRSTSADKGLGTMPNDMLLEIIARMAPMKRVYREIGA